MNQFGLSLLGHMGASDLKNNCTSLNNNMEGMNTCDVCGVQKPWGAYRGPSTTLCRTCKTRCCSDCITYCKECKYSHCDFCRNTMCCSRCGTCSNVSVCESCNVLYCDGKCRFMCPFMCSNKTSEPLLAKVLTKYLMDQDPVLKERVMDIMTHKKKPNSIKEKLIVTLVRRLGDNGIVYETRFKVCGHCAKPDSNSLKPSNEYCHFCLNYHLCKECESKTKYVKNTCTRCGFNMCGSCGVFRCECRGIYCLGCIQSGCTCTHKSAHFLTKKVHNIKIWDKDLTKLEACLRRTEVPEIIHMDTDEDVHEYHPRDPNDGWLEI